MSAVGKPMLVGWKVSTLASNIASVRYRAVIPMLALESTGVRSRLFSSGLESNLDGVDVLVIVKSFTADDLRLAQLAAAKGTRVVYDLCDNIFIGDYASRRHGVTPAQMFLSIADHASCVVVTTEPLAEVVRAQVPNVPVVVIPDGIETLSLAKRISRVLRDAVAFERAQRLRIVQQRVRNVVRRVRTEGVGLIPSLVGYVARRMGGALVGPVRRRLHRRTARQQVPAAPTLVVGAQQAAPAVERPAARRIVWFGNHGAEHASFGMLDILVYREALETLAKEQDIELVVISNNHRKYLENIAPLAIPSRYLEWSAKQVDQALKDAAAVIVPNTLDPFSICKSPNRTVLALASGVPVVATMTPALHPLADYLYTGDPLEALRRLLADPAGERAKALDGYRRAEALYGMKAIQVQWLRLLRELPEAGTAEVLTQPYLAVVLHLAQDLDLALPVLKEAHSAGVTCEAWCSASLFTKSPRVLTMLKAQQIPFRVLPNEEGLGRFTFPDRTRVLLTVAESSLGPHRVPRMLSEAAVRQGLFVATMQHGFENVGLTYEDSIHTMEKVTFAAQRIYIWGPLHTLHPRASATVRARCVPVGCPKEASIEATGVAKLLPSDRPVVGIFENLHWHRYTEDYKRQFLDNAMALARAYPHVQFVIKPHHAGLWLTKRYEGERPAGDNLMIVDPQSNDWENHTAAAFMEHLSAVITSPSTVALDAARLGIPVAVVAGDLALDNYLPLPLLNDTSDWLAFVAQALDPDRKPALQQQSAQFVDLVLVPGAAARRIVEDLRATGGA